MAAALYSVRTRPSRRTRTGATTRCSTNTSMATRVAALAPPTRPAGQRWWPSCWSRPRVDEDGLYVNAIIVPLDIARCRTGSALDKLELHGDTGPDRAVALPGERGEVEEDVIASLFSCDHPDAR